MNSITLGIAALFTVVLSACGGGGGGSTATVPPPNANAFPTTLPAVGDYFVYTSATTPTLPAGATPTSHTQTNYYQVVNSDGSLTRIESRSDFYAKAARAYTSAGATASYTSGTLLCTYTPAYQAGPLNTSVVGDNYSSASTESCATQPSGTPTTYSLSDTGSAVSVEQVTIPLGSFTAFKYSQTLVDSNTTSTTTTNESCWIDTTTGRTVKCTDSYSTVPSGQTAATATGTTTYTLDAYSFHGQAPIGPAVMRFTGYWNVQFAGSSTGKCDNLLIDLNGSISGNCEFLTSSGVYAPQFAVTGSVNVGGAASLSSATGASMSGTFNTPLSASGSWSNGAATGSWTASHV